MSTSETAGVTAGKSLGHGSKKQIYMMPTQKFVPVDYVSA